MKRTILLNSRLHSTIQVPQQYPFSSLKGADHVTKDQITVTSNIRLLMPQPHRTERSI